MMASAEDISRLGFGKLPVQLLMKNPAVAIVCSNNNRVAARVRGEVGRRIPIQNEWRIGVAGEGESTNSQYGVLSTGTEHPVLLLKTQHV